MKLMDDMGLETVNGGTSDMSAKEVINGIVVDVFLDNANNVHRFS